ncbi:MAG TPA: universal stress protein [Longimicrobiaceae bacterium]|nr:universal stress protein [Longimicrobiaceae bacterium]
MYRSILVPLDGTPFGEHALPAAMAIARRTGAALHLVHVHVPETAWSAIEGVPHLGANLRELVVQREQGYLDGVRERLAASGVAVDARILDGPVARTLAESARQERVDLVALSTHAHTGLSRLWHRGVASYLTRHLSVPVLLVHAPDAPAELDVEVAVRRVLLPLGGRAYSERVLDHAVELGRACEARFTLLEVVAPPVETGYTLLGQDGHVNEFELQERRERALGYLEGVAGRLRARGVHVDAEVVPSSDAASAIVDYVERAGAAGDPVGIIAMETHGLGGAAHLFTPSVVEQVVHETSVPVLAHHTAVAEGVPLEDGAAMGWGAQRGAAAPGDLPAA